MKVGGAPINLQRDDEPDEQTGAIQGTEGCRDGDMQGRRFSPYADPSQRTEMGAPIKLNAKSNGTNRWSEENASLP